MKMRAHAWRAKTSQGLALSKDMKCRKRTLHKVRTGTWWLGSDGLDAVQREAWKESGQVFSVIDSGVELFPICQFLRIAGRLQPRPCIRLVLEALGPVKDQWTIAAWFYFANRWIVERHGSVAKHLSPAEALKLGMEDQVVRAAELRLGSYVA